MSGVTRVTVDQTLCVGSGQCELFCPEVFTVVDSIAEVDEGGLDAADPADLHDAADACPTQAIRVHAG